MVLNFYEISPDNKIPQHNYYRKQLNQITFAIKIA